MDDMVGSGVSMTAGKNVARVVATVVALLFVLVVGPASTAVAAAPNLAITSPSTASSTNSQTPLFSGTTDDTLFDPITLKVHEGGTAAGTVVQTLEQLSAPLGIWELTPVTLEPKQYTAVAEQTSLGETGSAEVTFTVDTTAPVVSLSPVLSPTNDATPKLEGAGGIAEGDIATATVTVYKGGLVGGTVAATGSVPVTTGSWSYTSTHLEDGTYTAEATQKDEAGNEGTSAEVTFTVDTTAPVVSLSPVPSPTNNATPALTGGAGSAVGDDSTAAVKIYKGTSAGGTAVASGSASVVGGAWSFMSPHLADGTYTAQTTQSDEAGNSGKSAPSTFTVDTTPPLVGIASPANGSHVTTAKPTFSGTAGNQTGDEASVSVNIYAEGNLEQTLHMTRSGTSWTTGSSGPALANGIYTLQVAQTDSAGNTGVSSPVTFTVEAPGPEVTLNSLPSFIASATPSFSGTAPATEAEPNITVKIYNGASVGGPVVASGSAPVNKGEWSFTSSHLANGTYTMQAEQRDDGGHVGHSHASTFKIDTIPPRVTLTLPLGGSSTSGESQLVEGAAGEKPVYKQEIKIKLFAGSNVVGEPAQALEVFASKGAWNATFAGLGPGTYTAQAEQLDEFGFPGTSEPVTFTVKPPPVVTPEAASPPPAVTVSPPAPPVASFQWFPSAPHTGEPVSLVSTSTGASSPITGFAWALAGSGAFSVGPPALSTTFSTPGSHIVRLRVTDANGLSSVAAETIAVSSPAVTLMQPFPVVRIAGSIDAAGAKLSLLTVQAPGGAQIMIRCRGRGCPKTESRVVASGRRVGTTLVEFRRFERSLRVGAVLEIRISKGGEIGKYTRFTIRRGKPPVRVDTCLSPAGIKPIACPSS
jgi:major membrane immunogen (membrane-anchored lipoprotein)